MCFSLQDLVRQTLAEAEEREKVAQLQQEPDRDESKKKEEKREGPDNKTTPKETGNTPERNYESYGEKTSSVFVEKLASAVEFLNAHFIKEAVGTPEPPLSHDTMHTTVGPGIGQTSLETNVKSMGEMKALAAPLKDRARFIGVVQYEEVPKYYAASDIIVISCLGARALTETSTMSRIKCAHVAGDETAAIIHFEIVVAIAPPHW